jgi:hypothetical protein
MNDIIAFLSNAHNLSLIFMVLFAISEFLGMSSKIAANGIFQLIAGFIKKGHEKFPEQK